MTDTQESMAIIAEGSQFALSSTPGGANCVLRSKEDNTAAHLQDEDARALLRDYASIQAQYPAYTTDQSLVQLWDQGGYSWMAVPDGP